MNTISVKHIINKIIINANNYEGTKFKVNGIF